MDNQKVYQTICPKCGNVIAAGLKFCPHCGDKFVEDEPVKMVCPNCGKVAPTGEKFCSECGTAYAAKQGSAPVARPQTAKPTTSTPAAPGPKIAPETAVGMRQVQNNRGMSQNEFFEKYANGYTKGWAKWLPRIGILSAILYFVLMIVRFVNGAYLSGVFMIFDIFCVGGCSLMIMQNKKAAYAIAFAAYNGIASIIAFFDMDFSNLLWLAASIFLAVKMWKVEKAYQAYVQTGVEPAGRI